MFLVITYQFWLQNIIQDVEIVVKFFRLIMADEIMVNAITTPLSEKML